ncbi:Uncharacterized protein APZ42_024236 [Daphnia magna]|uniref:Uncharacterized protein n=1 Tax=Daphnia magna TaxID=35525 RepID=A0A0P5W3N9_9CRUS|nr:Uncharacterized protein APZ42_024236 [Daphnia magna]
MSLKFCIYSYFFYILDKAYRVSYQVDKCSASARFLSRCNSHVSYQLSCGSCGWIGTEQTVD